MTTPQLHTARGIPVARPAVPALTARAWDVLGFEWIKLRSVRSNGWIVLIAAVVTIGITAIVAHSFAAAPGPPPGGLMTPLAESFLGYAEYTVLPVSVLGVLVFTSEYSTGLIRTTVTAVPRRWAVLAAKAAVAGTAALGVGELLAFASFFLTQAILSGGRRGISLASPGVPTAVLAAGFLLCVCVLAGLGLGAIIRHTAGAIAATIGVIYLVAVVCLILPSPWNVRIGRFTLPFAAYQVVARHPQAGLFSPGVSLLILIAWPAAILVTAGILLTRRDL
jgi:ABC-2 type transport system permease protein